MSHDLETARHRFIGGKMRHLSGWKPGARPAPGALSMSVPFLSRFTRPERAWLKRMDWIRIEDQGSIGSCVFNATSSAFEYVIRKQTGEDIQLSRLAGYAWGRDLAGIPLTEDSGSYNGVAMRVLAEIGLPPESEWPYDLSRWTVEPHTGARADASKHKLGLFYHCPNLATIEAAICQDFPVAIGFECFASLMDDETMTTGKVPFTPKDEIIGGHAVMAVGYDRALQELYFANSWGTSVGFRAPNSMRGYFALPYAFFKQGYADEAVTPRTVVRG